MDIAIAISDHTNMFYYIITRLSLKKSLIPAFSRLTTNASPDHAIAKSYNKAVVVGFISFRWRRSDRLKTGAAYTAQQDSQLCGPYCRDHFCTRPGSPGEFLHQRRVQNAFVQRGLLSVLHRGLSTPTLQPVIAMVQRPSRKAVQYLTRLIPSRGGTSAHLQATQNRCSKPWTLQLDHWTNS